MFDFIGDTWDWVCDNPIKSCAIVVGTIATAGAGPIAAALGATGALATTSSGTVISTLGGAALRSASLKAIGAMAGMNSMTGGVIVIGTAGTGTGAAAGTAVKTIKNT